MSILLIKLLYYISWSFSIVLSVNILLALFNRILKHTVGRDVFLKNRNRSFKTKLLVASPFLIGAVWSLRFAVGYYSVFNPPEGSVPLTPLEEVFNSLVHTLQTFSLDEDYTEYITNGRIMMAAAFGEGTKAIDIYGVYAAVLNFLVPVAGGAIVFEIISEFSPRMRLLFANLRVWTKKYYFSELNDNSLALAKNIVDIERNKACIIFTDAYTDDEEEKGSERLSKAKSIGAICLKDDLLNIRLHGRTPKIFLIDGSEISNLQSLTALLERRDKKTNNAQIFIFSSDKKFSNIDEDVAFIVNQEEKMDMMPAVIPVNGLRNMACRLFVDVPLYEPLLNNDSSKEKTIIVTILGSGAIGTEFFLTTYWCGQMLDCKLHINVVSKEKQNEENDSKREGNFEGRINFINPEILKTNNPNSDLLIYSEDGERSEPYFSYKYRESDVLSDDFVTLMEEPELLNTDYFIVALGSDEDNLEVANKLRQIVGVHHMYSAPKKKTVISYVIYNSELCCALNKKQKYNYVPNDDENNISVPDVFMVAFGDLDSVYSVQNVFLEDISNSALELQKTYDLQKSMLEAEKKIKYGKNKRFKDIYSYQSNLAKRFHRKYKMFSAGFIESGIFTFDEKTVDAETEFIKFITLTPKDDKIKGLNKTKKELLDELAWLEHRRWCAYLRTKGFTNPGKSDRGDYKYVKYLNIDNKEHTSKEAHKFISLKLHPCLVECSKKGIASSRFDDRGFLITESEVKQIPSTDYLDDLSNDRAKRTNIIEDFKKWDYPEFDLESNEISKDQVGSSNPYDVSGVIDAIRIYLSGGKKYISIDCFKEALKEICKSNIKKARGKTDDCINQKIIKAMDQIKIEKTRPFEKLDIEMIEYSKVDLFSNQLLCIVKSLIEQK